MVAKEHATSPQLTCRNCDANFCGGATHIAMHIMEKCACTTEAVMKLKQEVIEKDAEKKEKKARLAAAAEVYAAADVEQKPDTDEQKVTVKKEVVGGRQQNLKNSFATATSDRDAHVHVHVVSEMGRV